MSRTLLEAELEQWAEPPRLWWRDDDAVTVTPALERLTQLTGDAGIAVLLAVIPAHADDALANHVALYRHLDPCVHGWAHANHEPEGARKAELGLARPIDAVVADVARGHERLQVLFGAHLLPVLVPPWNRMRADLPARLGEVGLEAFSGFGHKIESPGRQANAHVDLIDWRTRAGKPVQQVLAELSQALAMARQAGGQATGILTHHLAHDEQAWAVCDMLSGLDRVRWVRFPGSTDHGNAIRAVDG